MSEMTLGSLFSGAGGFELAASRWGIKPVWASEIVPYAVSVTSARFPEMAHLGDITKMDGHDIPTVDVVTGGSPCFPAGTLVATKEGYKPIEKVTVLDQVLTHTGRYRQVLESGYTGTMELWRVEGMAIDSILTTRSHRFYVRHRSNVWDNSLRRYRRVFGEPEWVETHKLKRGDYIGTPVIQTEENPLALTDEECWLIGRYIADGYTRSSQRPNRPEGSRFCNVVFCVGNGKQDEFTSHIHSFKYGVCALTRNVQKYTFVSKRLTQLCEACGCGAENKVLPGFLLNLPVGLLKLVIDGYMSGDGDYSHARNQASSISKKLMYSLGLAVAKAYHATYSIYMPKIREYMTIEGRTVHCHQSWLIHWKGDVRPQDKAFYEDGMIWSPVNSVERTHKSSAVYDIEVEEDHSFLVNNIAVHNCTNLSTASNREGLQGEQSRLFWEMIRVIREMKEATNGKSPRYVVFENVPGALSCHKGEDFWQILCAFASLCQRSVHVPRSEKWANAGVVVGDGWSLCWRVLSAEYFGVAQHRKRLYLVLDCGSERAHEILFERKSGEGLAGADGTCGQRAAPPHC